MKCQDCELLLEEYLDGETDGRATSAIAAHLRTCAACSAAYDGLLAEQSLYASYERGVEVTPALWAGVEARLRAESTEAGGKVGFLRRLPAWFAPLLVAPRFSPALTAALVVVAVVATAVVMKSVGGGTTRPPLDVARADKQGGSPANATTRGATAGESPQPAPAATQTPAESSPSPAAPFSSPKPEPKVVKPRPDPNQLQQAAGPPPKHGPKSVDKRPAGSRPPLEMATADRLVREAEQRYVAAIRILERDVKTRRKNLDPGTRARFDETLASIDRTIAETRKTAKQHGNDPVAVQYMLSAYQKKVEVMREMAALGGQ